MILVWHKYKVMVSAIILMLMTLLFFYGDIILHPNSSLLWIYNDGLKNAYMFTYYLQHNQSFLMHEGMSYPMSEYLFVTDSHPLLVLFLKIISIVFPFLASHPVGVMNTLLFLSPLVSVAIFTQLFKRFDIPDNINVIASIAIPFFSSQFLLLSVGHYSLSFSFFIPLNLYLLLRFSDKPRSFKILFALFALSTVAFFIHTYQGAILVAFNMSFLVLSLFHKNRKQLLWLGIPILATLLTIALLYALNPYTDRVIFSMHTSHRSDWSTVILPNYSHLVTFFKPIFDFSELNNLPWSRTGTYIGIGSILFILIGFTSLLYNGFKGRLGAILAKVNPIAYLLIGSSIALLIFASGYPTRLDQGFIFNKIPFVWQIVATSRFAYAFFYVTTFFTIVFAYRFIKHSLWKLLIPLLIAGTFIIEGLGMHQALKDKLPARINVFDSKIFDKTYNYNQWDIDVNDYDAVLPMPRYAYYYLPETLKGTISSEELSMATSMRTGLPIAGVYLSRPSISNSRLIANIVDSTQNLAMREAFSGKRLLVAYTNEPLFDQQQKLLAYLHDTIYVGYDYTLFSLEVDDWIAHNDTLLLAK